MGEVTPPEGRSAGEFAGRLADVLRGQGDLTDPEWARSLHEVPRHLFTPATAWAVPDRHGERGGRIDVIGDPAAWWRAVYSESSIVLQEADGAGDPASGQGRFTSSLSAPGMVFSFLELLDPRPADRILEIGTGSGWTAALLAWRAGPQGITSIEVDPQIAAQAAANLRAAGWAPHLIVGDGVKGCPERAPFDRVHVTAGVSDIPPAWIEQTRPGGVIVLPWHTSGRTGLGHRLRLTVLDGGTALGSFHGPARYMMLRDQRCNARWNSHHHEAATHSTTRLDPRKIVAAERVVSLMCAAPAPRVGWYEASGPDGTSLLLYELDDAEGAWAACDQEPGVDEYQVVQYGERRLWDEVAGAYLRWVGLGGPAYERFGVTVASRGVEIWVDAPSNVITRPV
ncbi:protein-L-isoaspartate(D-aspartate) O-methyltransferase [Spongiactinospora rosea]|uniref:Protein-L-isoaspartate O-methyltransferase n=1 Tax=Spongiactinospora rosea TaxID=2248750 RepID=A0A366M582_9ACTN|nr:protein-L-isoaspartate(D-aspartate) O-methyltransferase [Spongiactinospora rosea]RBQ21418.1 protein-L-isoaspartate(D-aspartate) O-methyltransferase [Spongiactinospora rosea]